MPLTNWDDKATKQFDSLNDDIRREWAELRELTLKNK